MFFPLKSFRFFRRLFVITAAVLIACISQAQLHVQSLTINVQTVLSYGVAYGTVTLSEPSPEITRVRLFSSEDIVEMPQFIKIPADTLSMSFPITGKPVNARTWTTISAAITKDFVRKRMFVDPPDHPTIHFTHPWLVGGSMTWAQLDCYTKLVAGMRVDLTSSDPTAVTIPDHVRIGKNKAGIQFELISHPVTEPKTVTIGGTIEGKPFNATISIRPPIAPAGWFPIGTNPNMLNNGGKLPSVLIDNATTVITTRMRHFAATANGTGTEEIRLVYANYDTEENRGERVPPNAITIKAGIERAGGDGTYQELVPTAVTFGGMPTATIAPGDYGVSDPIHFPLENGEAFYTRTAQMVADPTMVMCGGLATEGTTELGGFDTGEGMIAGDYSYTGYIPPLANRGGYSPSAILGYSDAPPVSLGLVGDSIMSGTGDSGFRTCAGGYAERAVMRQFNIVENQSPSPLSGYVHFAKGAETGKTFTKSTIRFELSCLADTIVSNYINNDIGDYDEVKNTEADIKETLLRLARRYIVRGKRLVVTTCNPKATSIDGFRSVTGQTPISSEAVRVSLNNWLRDPAGFAAEVGAPEQIIVWDICRDIEVNANNEFEMNGGYWASSPQLVESGDVSSNSYLSKPSFKDRTKFWVPNALSGLTVTFTSGPNTNRSRPIELNDSAGHVVVRGGFPSVNHLGNTYVINSGIYSFDGTHPTSTGHAAIAATFPYLEVFGLSFP
jgi:hypothetical protein